MLTYTFTARDTSTGKKVKAQLQANSKQAAAKMIRDQGYAPIDINEETGGKAFGIFKAKVKTKDKILFSRQLATLINAGLPLVQGLRSVGEQTQSKPMKAVIDGLISDVETGTTFAAALEKYPKVFNQIFISLIASGETSGTLDKSLERLAVQQEKDAEIMSKVRGALTYPAIVLVVMGGVMAFMITQVLPQVEVLYDGIAGAELPLVTRIMLAISHAITNFWYLFIIFGIGGGYGLYRWSETPGGKRVFDKVKMRAWPIGPLFMKLYMARFTRTTTTLTASGVPLLQVLDISARAINNVYLSESIKRASEKIKSGKSLSESIHGDPNFLPLVPDMLKIGEQSGAMEQMMDKAATYYENEVDQQIKSISTIIEPVLMVILGLVAFIIVAAVLLPVYGLAGKSIL